MNVVFWVLVALTGLWVLTALGALAYRYRYWPRGQWEPMTEAESAAVLRGIVIGQIL